VPHRRHIEGILKRGIERAAPANAPTLPELSTSMSMCAAPATTTRRMPMTLDETLQKLIDLKLDALAKGLREMMEMPPDR
jgi:hypothetical protein